MIHSPRTPFHSKREKNKWGHIGSWWGWFRGLYRRIFFTGKPIFYGSLQGWMQFFSIFRVKKKRYVLNRGGTDIKCNSPFNYSTSRKDISLSERNWTWWEEIARKISATASYWMDQWFSDFCSGLHENPNNLDCTSVLINHDQRLLDVNKKWFMYATISFSLQSSQTKRTNIEYGACSWQ